MGGFLCSPLSQAFPVAERDKIKQMMQLHVEEDLEEEERHFVETHGETLSLQSLASHSPLLAHSPASSAASSLHSELHSGHRLSGGEEMSSRLPCGQQQPRAFDFEEMDRQPGPGVRQWASTALNADSAVRAHEGGSGRGSEGARRHAPHATIVPPSFDPHIPVGGAVGAGHGHRETSSAHGAAPSAHPADRSSVRAPSPARAHIESLLRGPALGTMSSQAAPPARGGAPTMLPRPVAAPTAPSSKRMVLQDPSAGNVEQHIAGLLATISGEGVSIGEEFRNFG